VLELESLQMLSEAVSGRLHIVHIVKFS